MERWKEVFIGTIPKAVYQMQLINGEMQGLTIELLSSHTHATIHFGIVQAVRMLDEELYKAIFILTMKYRNIKLITFRI